MNYNSIKNQEIKGKLVQRHILSCQTSLVDHLRQANFDDFETENEYYYRVELSGGEEYFTEDDRQERIEELQEKLEKHEENEPDLYEFRDAAENDDEAEEAYQETFDLWEQEKERIEEDIEALEDAEMEPKEVYEYWLVDDWFLSKLRNCGECIVEHTPTREQWWGRGTTGQAILLDHVISQIAEDMQILEGQQNEW